MRNAFRALDRDGSGRISRTELLNGLLTWNLRASESQLNQLMRVLDCNGDGEVSFEEFNAAFRAPVEKPLLHECEPSPKLGRRRAPPREGALATLVAPIRPASRGASPGELGDYEASISDHIYVKYKLLRDAFRSFDEDKDGLLTHEELLTAVNCFNLGIPRAHVLQICQRCDRNGDGLINYEEFAAALKRKDALGN